MTAQFGLALEGGAAIDPKEGWSGEPGNGELGADDTLPPGPYRIGLTRWQGGDEAIHEGLPYVVRCGDGRAVAGHVPSRRIAEAIADALNRAMPQLAGLSPAEDEADSIGSYNAAIAAIGERVRAGEPVPEFMLSRKAKP